MKRLVVSCGLGLSLAATACGTEFKADDPPNPAVSLAAAAKDAVGYKVPPAPSVPPKQPTMKPGPGMKGGPKPPPPQPVEAFDPNPSPSAVDSGSLEAER